MLSPSSLGGPTAAGAPPANSTASASGRKAKPLRTLQIVAAVRLLGRLHIPYKPFIANSPHSSILPADEAVLSLRRPRGHARGTRRGDRRCPDRRQALDQARPDPKITRL